MESSQHDSQKREEVLQKSEVLRPQKQNKNINSELIKCVDKHSLEEVVEAKVGRFLDQLGSVQYENMHDLIMSKVEKPLLVQILRRVGGNQVRASKILGINRNTLRKKIKHYSLD